MKTFLTAMLLTALVMLALVPSRSFAQSPDTVVVSALPPGNLNDFINGDTTATGQQNNHVYVLAQTGTVDTTYFLTAPIRVSNLTLIGRTNPNTGHPPVIAPYINSDNSSPGDFFEIKKYGTMDLENLYLVGTRTDGSTVTGTTFTALGDTETFRLNHCIIENFGSSGTPNLVNMWSTGDKLFVTNCEFRNNQDDSPQNPGLTWLGPGTEPMDTAEYVNNTFFLLGGCILGGSGYCGYCLFDHNTVFFQTKSGLFQNKQMMNVHITNNIIYGSMFMGMDSTHAYGNYNANFFTLPAAITIDTLINFTGSPWNFTEAQRVIQVKNNAYFWPKQCYDFWNAWNDTATSAGVGRLIPPAFVATANPNMLTDHSKWPGIVFSGNDSTDPGFAASLVSAAADSLVHFEYLGWTNRTSGGYRPFVYLSDPVNMFAGVPSDWASKQNYPVPENLAYSKAGTLVDSLGFSLGDLNWYPAQLKLWEEGKVNAVRTPGRQVPAEFALSQNYPNPFNPSTEIKVSLVHSGLMSLTIYNVLGQVVQVVNQGYKPAGEYTYNVNMDRFASGVYFYSLHQGANVITKKMLLLK